MSGLPIVERELRVRARLAGTHRLRWLVAGSALLLATTSLFVSGPGRGSNGYGTFVLLTGLAMLVCVLEGPHNTADCLSEERREGTLGLLFLTELRAGNVVLGKLVACSLNSFYGLLAIVPVMALPLLVGGVTFTEFGRVVLVLFDSLFLSLCVGLWVSARNDREHKAVMATFLGLAGIFCLPLVLDALLLRGAYAPQTAIFSRVSPAFGCMMAFECFQPAGRAQYWSSLGIVHLSGWMFFLGSGWRLRNWQAPVEKIAAKRKNVSVAGPRISGNPMSWLARRRAGVSGWLWVLALLSFGASFAGAMTGPRNPALNLTMSLLYQLWFLAIWISLAWIASRCLAEARTNGALELLLTTPLSPQEIIQGLRRGVWRTAWLLVAAYSAFYVVATLSSWLGLKRTLPPGVTVHLTEHLLGELVSFVADAWAVIWVGMWFGLTSKKPIHATAKTFFYVVLIPRLLRFIFPALVSWVGPWRQVWVIWACLVVAKDLAFVKWSRRKLETQFREAAACAPGEQDWAARFRLWAGREWRGLEEGNARA